jgi:hypothetical protein
MAIGLPQPLNAFRFRVVFKDKILSEEQLANLTQSVTKVELDLVNKNGSMTVKQTVLPDSLPSIVRLIKNKMTFTIDCLEPTSEVINSISCYRLKILEHNQQFSYEDSKIVDHRIKFKFGSYYIY